MNDLMIPIILAAGRGTRFGKENKLFQKIGEKKLLENTLEPFIRLFKLIIVVTGYDKAKMVKFLTNYDKQIIIVHNNNWKDGGMSSSIKVGLECILKNYSCSAILIHPGDTPFITDQDLQSIINETQQEDFNYIIIPQFESRGGHPISIPKRFFSEVEKISESTEGLKQLLKNNSQYVKYVSCSEQILKDIDYKSDLQE